MLGAQIEVMSLAAVGGVLFLGMTHAPLVTVGLGTLAVVGLYLRADYSIRRARRSDVEQAKHEYVTDEIGELEFEKRLEQAMDE